ncbi:DUF397 domain-containing protein [Spirillospora sp. NBC_00431]
MADYDLSRAAWRKSSRSGSSGGDCVEVAMLGDLSAVRDSKNPEGGHLTLERVGWTALLSQIKQGAYDL